MYTIEALYDFLGSYKAYIEKIKVTKLEVADFNEMEGYQWYFNVKVFLENGKSKLVKIHSNSTYMEDFTSELENEVPTKENLTKWLQETTM